MKKLLFVSILFSALFSYSQSSSKEELLAKEEAYMIEQGKFIKPYAEFVEKLNWGAVITNEQLDLFKKMDYDLFLIKNKEIESYKPIDNAEFYNNENKYLVVNSFLAVSKFYSSNYNPEGESDIKKKLLDELRESYSQYNDYKEKEGSQYYEIDRRLESFNKAIRALEFWCNTDFFCWR